MAEIDVPVMTFTRDETAAFNQLWISLVSIWNRDGMLMIFTDADRELTLTWALHMKEELDGDKFVVSADNDRQFTMVMIRPQDVLQDDASNAGAPGAGVRVLDWLQDEALTPGEWVLGRRNWISSRPANTGSFDDAADGSVRFDTADGRQNWGMVILALQEINPSPIVRELLREINNQPKMPVPLTWQLVSSELQLHKLAEPLMLSPTTPTRLGLGIVTRQPGAAGVGGALAGASVESYVIPVGFAFINQDRANGTIDSFAILYPRPRV